MHVAVIGTGYVGLVSGACLADMGHTVTAYDTAPQRLARLAAGEVPFYEPQLTELVQRTLRAESLRIATELPAAVASAAVCLVAVGTPPLASGACDLTQVLAACDAVAAHAPAELVVAIKSTVPPGTCRALQTRLQRGGSAVQVVANPEFLKEGAAVEDFRRPDRVVVGGLAATAVARLRELYAPLLRAGQPFLAMSPEAAELTKYASNAALAARISLINEVADLCQAVGADVADVRRGVAADRRLGGAYLYPGLGFGGACFPKDLRALAALGTAHGVPTAMLDATLQVNRRHQTLLATWALEHLPKPPGDRRVAVWGLAFKPRTDDVREAPALKTIAALLAAGVAVTAFDPVAMDNARAELPPGPRLRYAPDLYDCLQGADALLLCTEWECFCTPDFAQVRARLRTPLVLDGRNQYDPETLRALGLRYLCIGRPAV